MSLQEQLAALKADFKAKLPADIFERLEKSVHDLEQTRLGNDAPKIGENLAEFVLPNQSNEHRSLADLRAKGPVVVVFYRGGWCPYCNLELRNYQQILPQLKDAGATLPQNR